MLIEATVTCPNCGTRTKEVMPVNACQHGYVCPGCRTLLRPKAGDCCVFCADVMCPPRQATGAGRRA